MDCRINRQVNADVQGNAIAGRELVCGVRVSQGFYSDEGGTVVGVHKPFVNAPATYSVQWDTSKEVGHYDRAHLNVISWKGMP